MKYFYKINSYDPNGKITTGRCSNEMYRSSLTLSAAIETKKR